MAEKSDETARPAEPKKRRGAGRPFQPGQSGNPGGRPKRSETISEFLSGVTAAGKNGEEQTRREMVMRALYVVAIDRTHRDMPKAAELLLAYDLGRPRDRMELSGPNGAPIATEDLTPQKGTTGEKRKRIEQLLKLRAERLSGADGAKK